jgi:phosphate transport system protein
MLRGTLDKKHNELVAEIILLKSMVKEAIAESVWALKVGDLERAREVYVNDHVINQRRFAIEDQTLAAIATQQPMAIDLRILASILEVNTELERIGDYAKGIARITLLIDGDVLPGKVVSDLVRMTEIGLDMLDRAIAAFIDRDLETARRIPEEDDKVDVLYIKINNELFDLMIQDSGMIDTAKHLQWAAHNLERMADRITNICERTIFVTTGILSELEESRTMDFD